MTLLKQIIRSLIRNKLFTIVNIFGLSVATAVIVLLSVYISNERSVDHFHENSDLIYRVIHDQGCKFNPTIGQYIVENIAEVESFVRTFEMHAHLKYGDTKLYTDHALFVDSNFFQMFSFPLAAGNRSEVLDLKNSIVLTESFARKMFGNENPIGKTIRYYNRLNFVVSGIAKDFDHQTHFNNPDVIIPYHAYEDVWSKSFLESSSNRYFLCGLYVKTNSNANMSVKGEELYQKLKTWYWIFQEGNNTSIEFQPLKKAYLNPVEYGYPTEARSGNERLLKFLVLIIFAIGIIAAINFINLHLSQLIKRSKENGVRRINGATYVHSFARNCLEAFLVLGASLIISFFLVVIALPIFNQFTGFTSVLSDILNQQLVFGIIISTIGFTFLMGLFPVMLQKGKSLPLSNHFDEKTKVSWVQKSIIVTQFAASIALMITLLGIVKQNNFIKNFDIGFNTNETLYVKLNSEINPQKQAFKEELSKIAGINNVSLCPGSMPGVGIFTYLTEINNQNHNIDLFFIDQDYFKTMEINCNNPIPEERNSIWINEVAAKKLDLKTGSQLNANLSYGEQNFIVQEVLQNQNFHSLYKLPKPTFFIQANSNMWTEYALLNINTREVDKTIADIETTFGKFSQNFPFVYAFLNDKVNQAYQKETNTSKAIGLFALIAIILSSLGIFSLAVYTCQNKIKEIGIRKVNGARTMHVLNNLNKSFIQWIVIACFAAIPVAWLILTKWLQSFAYRTTISWWVFAVAGGAAVVVALLTVSFQSIQAANKNPVEALRYE